MVSFQQIQAIVAENADSQYTVSTIRILPALPIDRYELPKVPVVAATIPKKSVHIPLKSMKTEEKDSDSDESLPPPTRSVGIRVPLAEPPVEPTVVPTIIEKEPNPKVRPQTSLPTPKGSLDPVCIAIELQDAMYSIASPNVRLAMECEEARRLESMVDRLYKEESGRSRGWTKTKLTEFIVPRAAGRPKIPFDWSAIWTQKEASALLDFVCLAKGIRLAVWKSETEVGLWPAADKEGTQPSLYHVGSTGMSLKDRAISNTVRILAPYSVVAALEKLSVDELESVAQKMDVSLPTGKKGERAAFLASARMRLRLA